MEPPGQKAVQGVRRIPLVCWPYRVTLAARFCPPASPQRSGGFLPYRACEQDGTDSVPY